MDSRLSDNENSALSTVAASMRKDILAMGLAAGTTGIHLGGSLSCVEIISALFFNVMRFDSNDPASPNRDRFVFSKGHGAPALYAALHQLGIIDDEEVATFKQPNSFLTGHPSRNVERGVEYSSGSLGQGLSLGVGACLALRQLGNDESRCFVLLGDGECDEGSVWEAAMSASHYKLGNLCAIIDANVLQYDGPTDSVLSLGDFAGKWKSFGWDVEEIDGHDFRELVPSLSKRTEVPRVVIAHTVKGKGASFAEGVAEWHNARLTAALYNQAIEEIETPLGNGGRP